MAYGTDESIFKIEHFNHQGKGLAFKNSISNINDIIVMESPIIAYKHKFSKITTLSCDYCFKCVGSLNDYINYLSKIYPKLHFNNDQVSNFIECDYGCGNIYCSSLCYQKSINDGHYILCKMDSLSKLYWDDFERYSMGISETFIFAGLIIIQILYLHVNNGCRLEDQMDSYLEFYNKPWYEIKAGMEDSIKIALSKLVKSLSEYIKTNSVDVDKLLSFDFYSRIMGMIELVALDIEVESSHNELIFNNINNLNSDIWKKIINGLESSINLNITEYLNTFGSELIPDVLGLGIFNTFSRMNHSCIPNIEINYNDNFIAHGKLLCGVGVGEQAYISYIDEDLDKHERDIKLLKYMFKCKCKKCIG